MSNLIGHKGPEYPESEASLVSVLPCVRKGCMRRLDAYPARPISAPEDPATRAALEKIATENGWVQQPSGEWLCKGCVAGEPTLFETPVPPETLKKFAKTKINPDFFGEIKVTNL